LPSSEKENLLENRAEKQTKAPHDRNGKWKWKWDFKNENENCVAHHSGNRNSTQRDSTPLVSTQLKSSGQGSDRRTTGLTLGSGGLFASREVLKKAPRSVRDFGKT